MQTLSRLNRMIPGKDQTNVVDFVNDPDAIQEHCEDARVLNESDEHLVYNLCNKLDAANIYTSTDVDLLDAEWINTGRAAKHTAVLSRLGPAKDR